MDIQQLKDFLGQDNKKAQFVRFAVVGVTAAAVHYLIYFVCYHFMNEGVAYTMGYFLSFILNFYLTSLFTFRSKATTKKGVGFASAHLVNYFMHIGLFELFLWLGIPKAFIPIPVMGIAVPVNFFLVRFVFKH